MTGSQALAGLLDGVLVVDLSRALAGPQATMMLADLGARVIKVESQEGDESRRWGPPFVGDDEISTYFLSANRNKESVTADLKSAEGKALLEALVRRADVLVENFRPGVLARLGFSTAAMHSLNPRLVICSLSGFGHDGPDGGRAGYDQIAQGEAGLMSLTGGADGEPTRVGVPIADLLAGMNGAFGVVSALYERERTGAGRVVRASLLSSVVGIHAFQGTRATVAGERPRPEGNHHPSIAPYGLFHCSDGPIQIACGNDALWYRLCAVLELDPDDVRYLTNAHRVAARTDLVTLVNERLAEGEIEWWLKELGAAGVPAGRVRSLPEVYAWEQTRSQGLLIEVEHPTLGRLELPGPALRFDDNAFAGGRREHRHPPTLGEHDEAVRAWLTSDGTDVG